MKALLTIIALISCFGVCTALGQTDSLDKVDSIQVNQNPSPESRGIIVTRWMDPDGRQPISFEDWTAVSSVKGPFEIQFVRKTTPSERGTGFCVIVNSALYSSIETAIDQYVLDLESENYDVEVFTTSGGVPEDIRAFLQDRYVLGLAGAILIGDFPVPWYEAECWESHDEFPIDLYYMDMDGVWGDNDIDGMFDTHSGDVAPEIWIGRLTASPLTIGGADEVSLLLNYFDKIHLYRTDQYSLNGRALVYIDDDWAGSAPSWNEDVGRAYANRTLVYDEYTTWAPDYQSRLPQNYEFIQLCAHSSPASHWFTNPLGNWTWTDNSTIVSIDPVAHFYNLFACSNARYVEADYMAGWYIFCQTYGLAAVGSTKSGSMLEFDDFYSPFGQGMTIGEAFRNWFIAQAVGGFDEWEVCWFYGMTLCGDPTLTSKGASVWFTVDTCAGWVPFNATFTGVSTKNVVNWIWDFGDGDSAFVQFPFHTYETRGLYDVELQVVTISGDTISCVRPGVVAALTDTLYGDIIQVVPGQTVEVPINATNTIPLNELTIPIEFSGTLDLDAITVSWSTVGCRSEQFEYQQLIHFNPSTKQMTFRMDSDGAPFEMPPGSGPILKLFFEVVPPLVSGQETPLLLEGYGIYVPSFEGNMAQYEPLIVNGMITYVSSCCNVMGDWDHDGQLTISDLICMVGYMFQTGMSCPPPPCPEEVWLDEGSTPDIANLVSLVSYMFQNGPVILCP